jgi:ABC-2 type transport system permease protein
MALLKRDASVASRELPFFLLRTTMQPLLFVLVFGYVLPKMGFVARGYGAAMLPGILAISLAFASLQSVALPMVADFGWTREIEDRLLAPVPIELVALEKVLSGVVQGVIAALFVLPVARLMMGPIPGLDVRGLGSLLAITLLAAGTFSCFGLVLGTIINPAQIGLMFGFIVAPMIFFGCAYYPWQGPVRGADHEVRRFDKSAGLCIGRNAGCPDAIAAPHADSGRRVRAPGPYRILLDRRDAGLHETRHRVRR